MNIKRVWLILALLVLNVAIISAGISDGLVSYYKLDSNAVDSSNPTFSGTLNGEVNWIPSYINDGAQFAGSNDYIQIGEGTKYSDLCINGCTIVAWVNPSFAHTGTIVGRWDSTDNNYFFSLKSNSNLRPMFSFSESGSAICYAFSGWGDNFVYNQWNFVVGVYNKTNLLTYIGSDITHPGVSSSSCNLQGINSAAWQDSESTFIGVEDDGGLFNDFNGKIDEVRMYDRVLTQEEIEELYNYQGGIPSPYFCGDNLITGTEVCDGDLLNSQTCSNFGFDSGTLSCNSECTGYDLSQCFNQPVCNNNIVEGTEVCDGTALNSQTCSNFGFDSGTLSCNSECTGYDLSQCFNQPVCEVCSQCDSIFGLCTIQNCHNDCGGSCYYRGQMPFSQDCISITDACSSITQCSDYSEYECNNDPCNVNCVWTGYSCIDKSSSFEICDDKVDNDYDGLIDCNDDACATFGDCIGDDLDTFAKEINFGAVISGETKDITFVMNNTGDHIISGAITINSPFIIVSGNTYSLQPGAVHTAIIRFSPSALGHFSSELILSNSQGISLRAYGNSVSNLLNQQLNLPATTTPRFTVTDKQWPVNHGEADVCLWGDDKTAAVSISIDDNFAQEHNWWISQMEQRGGWSMTWFVITGWVGGKAYVQYGRWSDFQRLVKLGYDVQSHSVDHIDLRAVSLTEEELIYQYNESINDINENIPGYKASTIAYPYCTGNEPIARNFYSAARDCDGFPDTANKVNYMAVLTVGQLVPTWNNFQGNWLDKLIDPNTTYVRYYRGWLNLFKHTYQSYPKDGGVKTLYELDLLSSYSENLWIDSFTAVAHYGQERDTNNLIVNSVTSNSITFTLIDTMDDSVFTTPLTVKVRVNNDWNSVSAIQSGENVETKIIEYNGNKYVLVKAVPDRGEVVLTKE